MKFKTENLTQGFESEKFLHSPVFRTLFFAKDWKRKSVDSESPDSISGVGLVLTTGAWLLHGGLTAKLLSWCSELQFWLVLDNFNEL